MKVAIKLLEMFGLIFLLIDEENYNVKKVRKYQSKHSMYDGATPLFIASQNGHLEIIERLLKEKVNPSTSLETLV